MPSKHSTQGEKSGAEAARHRQSAQPASQEMVGLLPEVEQVVSQGIHADLSMATPDDILTLQRSVGNHVVHNMIQAKLTVGPVGDHYEQEADRVAQRVMSQPIPVGRPQSIQRQEDEEDLQMMPLIQRQEEEEDLQMKSPPLGGVVQRQEEEEDLQMMPLIQRQEEEEDLQMKSLPLGGVVQRQEEEEDLQMMPLIQRKGDSSFEAGSDVESRLSSRKGSGDALPDGTRADMESRFGANFSDVRVHADGEAVQLSQDLGAKAFTHGSDIYFGSGKYDPDSSSGQRLLAHELTHVVQQTGGQNGSRSTDDSTQSQVSPGADGVQRELSDSVRDYLEKEAKEEDQLGQKAPERIRTVYGAEGVRYWNTIMEDLVATKANEADLGTAPDAKWDHAYKVMWDLEMRPRIKTALLSVELGALPPEGFSPAYSDYWKLHMTVRLREEVKTAPLGQAPPELANDKQKEAWRTTMDQRIKETEGKGTAAREKELKKGWGKTFEGSSLSAWLPTRKKQKKERTEKLEQAREEARGGKRRRGARKEKTPWEVWLEQQAAKKKAEEAEKKKSEKTEEEDVETEEGLEKKKEVQSIPIEGLPNPKKVKNHCFLNSVIQVLAGSYKDLFDPENNKLGDVKKAEIQAEIWNIIHKVNKSERLVTDKEVEEGTAEVGKVTIEEINSVRAKMQAAGLVPSIDKQEDAGELLRRLLDLVMPDPGQEALKDYALETTETRDIKSFHGEAPSGKQQPTTKSQKGAPFITVPLAGDSLGDFLGTGVQTETKEWDESGGKNPRYVEIDDKKYYINKEQVTTVFSHLPKALTFQLVRFSYEEDEEKKIDKDFDMPFDFTILETRGEKQTQKKYELESYIVHHGLTSKSGHYTAGRKVDGKWYMADDETVSGDNRSQLKKGYLYTYKLVSGE